MSTALLPATLMILWILLSIISMAVITVALVLLIKIHNNTKKPKN